MNRSRRAPEGLALAPSDVELLELLAQGVHGDALARRLGLTRRTAERRQQQLRAQLGARNNVHAVVLALRRGLIA